MPETIFCCLVKNGNLNSNIQDLQNAGLLLFAVLPISSEKKGPQIFFGPKSIFSRTQSGLKTADLESLTYF